MKKDIIQADDGHSEEEYSDELGGMECWLTQNHLRQCKKREGIYRRYAIPGAKFIGVWTRGMMELPSETRERVEKTFNIHARVKDDWFYVVMVQGQKYFVADNGEFGYTAMLPEEY